MYDTNFIPLPINLNFKPKVNILYHFSIHFDIMMDYCAILIDGKYIEINESPTLPLNSQVGPVKHFRFGSFRAYDDPVEYSFYYDAFGFNWDPNYSTGDNLQRLILCNYIILDDNVSFQKMWLDYNNKFIETSEDIYVPFKAGGEFYTYRIIGKDLNGNYHFSDIAEFNTKVDVDVKIAYCESIIENFLEYEPDMDRLAFYVQYALNEGFGQYWDYMDFYTGTDDNWLVYDQEGYNQQEIESRSDYFKWSHNEAIHWNTNKSLPNNEGHGEKFDLLVLFIYDNSDMAGGWAEYVGGDTFVINYYHFTHILWGALHGWKGNVLGIIPVKGILSTIMHETGHCYGIDSIVTNPSLDPYDDATGDTSWVRDSVMDYWLSYYGAHMKFDAGHQRTIYKNLAYHSR